MLRPFEERNLMRVWALAAGVSARKTMRKMDRRVIEAPAMHSEKSLRGEEHGTTRGTSIPISLARSRKGYPEKVSLLYHFSG
jgi:hypothetical protein